MTTSGSNPCELLDRIPPQNLDAERGALGSLLLDSELCDDVAIVLKPADFYLPQHQVLYEHLLAMHNDGFRIDATLLHERLKKSGDLETIGGLAYLAEVADAVPTAHNAVYYAEIVRNKAALRSVIGASTETLRAAYAGDAEHEALLADAQARLDRIAETGDAAEAIAAPAAVAAAVELIRERASRRTDTCVQTGFTDFDAKIGGLFPGELVILAARPREGKTAMAGQLASHSAEAGRRVLFASLEMSAAELVGRLLCGRAVVDGAGIRIGRPADGDLAAIDAAAETMAGFPLWVDDRPAMSVRDVRWQARRILKRHGLDLLVVDYLQRLSPADPRTKRYEQVGQMARDLKHLARELKIPVLVLAQLSRGIESEKENRPKLSHLRESGDIEAEADVIAFLHRPELYKRNDADLKGQAELIVEKNRNGRTATFPLHWQASTTRFLTPGEEQEVPWTAALEGF